LPTSTVGDYLKRAEAAGIGWPSPDGQGEKELLQLAEHYGTAIIPARSKKPCDKAKVEAGVQVAERQILAALRDQRFFNVGQLNAAIIRPDVRG
jgi:transposase